MRYQHDDNHKPAGPASGFSAGQVTSSSPRLLRRLFSVGIISAVLVIFRAEAAPADITVDGSAGAVHVEALDAELREVLDRLQARFNLRYRSNDVLDTRKTGNFNGPLRHVVARILDGYDFAMKITPQGIDVLVLRQNDKPVAAARPARATPDKSAAPVLTAQEANRYERGRAR